MPAKKQSQSIGEPAEDFSQDEAAAAEWRRIVQLAEESGRPLQASDRSALTLYCRTWSINRQCYEHIKTFGAVVIWPNTIPGPSPQLRVWKETARLLRGMLADFFLTPASREKLGLVGDADEPGDLEF